MILTYENHHNCGRFLSTYHLPGTAPSPLHRSLAREMLASALDMGTIPCYHGRLREVEGLTQGHTASKCQGARIGVQVRMAPRHLPTWHLFPESL